MGKWLKELMCRWGLHDWDDYLTTSECKRCGEFYTRHGE